VRKASGNGGKTPRIITWSALRDLDVERQWIVENGILSERGKTIIYGEPGAGKTFLGLQLAHAIASGTDWLDTFHVPSPHRVLFCSGENPIDDIKGRILNMVPSLGDFSDDVGLMDSYEIDLSTPEGIATFGRCVDEHRAEVLIIDPLYIFARVDEVKLCEVVKVVVALNRFISDKGCSVVLLHHTTKDTFTSKGQEFDRGLNALRGAGWGMWAEAVLKLEKSKEGSQRLLTLQKVRSGPDGEKFTLEFNDHQTFSIKHDGEEAVLKYIKEHGPTPMMNLQRALERVPGCSVVRRPVGRLVRKGTLVWKGKGSDMVYFK